VKPDDFTQLTYHAERGVALVTLNRPDRRNAWSGPMAVEYRWALHHAHIDPDVRVVVLTGAGADFCAGADTGALDTMTRQGGHYERAKADLPPYPEGAPSWVRHNHTFPLAVSTPIIAAINGACAGAGFVLATYADLRFASTTARIATAFASLGLPAEYGIGWMLPRIVGVPNALRLLWDATPRSAAEAQQLGWVQEVYPAEALIDRSLDLAGRLARESSGASLSTMKRQVYLGAAGDLDQAYRRSVEDMDSALRAPDIREGLAARREHRAPDFLSQVWDG
jgi:enoyl-CoA hydratase/carnithine racemase